MNRHDRSPESSARCRWRPRRTALVTLLTALLLTSSAAADWLVTRDGSRIETAGEWRVDGRLVVFHLADGSLASMRLDLIDHEASVRATAEAMRPKAPAPPAEKKKAVMVLTDADVEHIDTSEPEAAIEIAAEPGDMEVVDYEEVDDPRVDGVVFSGNLRNVSDKMMISPRVIMTLVDLEGEEIATAEGDADAGFLRPTQSARFRVEFPDVFSYAGVEIETAGDGLSMRPEDAGGASSDEANGEAADDGGAPEAREGLDPADEGAGA